MGSVRWAPADPNSLLSSLPRLQRERGPERREQLRLGGLVLQPRLARGLRRLVLPRQTRWAWGSGGPSTDPMGRRPSAHAPGSLSPRWLLLTVQLQLPRVRPELQRPGQLLPVPGRLRQERRPQHELPVQIKARAPGTGLPLHLLPLEDRAPRIPVTMSSGPSRPPHPSTLPCRAVPRVSPDPHRDPYLAVFGTPRLEWSVRCHCSPVWVVV